MSRSVLLVSGSPSSSSRSTRLLTDVGARLEAAGFQTRHFSSAAFEPRELLNPTTETPNIRELVTASRASDALVVSTPVYKGTFSGVSKVILDLIPPDALVGKAALAIATARIAEQLPVTARALEGVFDFFKIGRVVPALTFTDPELALDATGAFSEVVTASTRARATELLTAIREAI